MQTLKLFLVISLFGLGFISCAEDENPDPMPPGATTFRVTVENVLPVKDYFSSDATPLVMPGESATLTFHAGVGMQLSLATMLVASNDLFFGFADSGLALYDANGDAVTGDITGNLELWDAGTEVNEEPGNGPNQPMNQAGPDTGTDEGGVVHVNDDGFTYPATEQIIRLELAHDGGTEFTLTVTNVSDGSALPTPLAPGVWVVHGSGTPIFTDGEVSSAGLEDIAEDGDNSILTVELAEQSGFSSPFAPGVYAVHDVTTQPLFTAGNPDRGEGLEELAEDGDPSILAGTLDATAGVLSSGVFNTPEGASDPGPLMPGNSYAFTFTAEDGSYFNLATMLITSNDLFYAFGEEGVALFANGNPISGDVTGSVSLWDSGTEVNQYPGAGSDQPIIGGPDTGAAENGNVRIVDDGFSYPPVSESIWISIETVE